jgi:subtilase family serine protease
VWVFANGSWYIVGGTSVSAPVWAGIVNSAASASAASFAASSQSELTTLYRNTSAFTDIKKGSCGPQQGYWAAEGWDFCTGLGSPVGNSGR